MPTKAKTYFDGKLLQASDFTREQSYRKSDRPRLAASKEAATTAEPSAAEKPRTPKFRRQQPTPIVQSGQKSANTATRAKARAKKKKTRRAKL